MLIAVQVERPEWLGRHMEVRRPSQIPADRQRPQDALDDAMLREVTGTDNAAGTAKNQIIAPPAVLPAFDCVAALDGPRR